MDQIQQIKTDLNSDLQVTNSKIINQMDSLDQSDGQFTASPDPEIKKIINQEEKFPQKPLQQQLSATFIQYNPVSAQNKLSNFVSLLSTQKIAYIKNLTSLLKEIGPQGLQLLPKLFSDIMQDREQVKRNLLSQISQLIKYISGLEDHIYKLKKYLVPVIIKIIQEPYQDMKQQAASYLAELAFYLDEESRGECILKHVLELAHDDTNQQNRIVAVQLFAKMANLFGKDLCEQFIGLEFQCLGEDINLKVRKQAITYLPNIAKVVGSKFFKNKIFEFYQDKVRQSHWALRKAAIQIIPKISQLCDSETKDQGILDAILLQFLTDSNKYVKASAYKSIGAYIHTLKGKQINPKLIEAYNKMATTELEGISHDNDIIYSCAYNFPAVLDALGSTKWSQLTGTYSKLLKIPDKKVKRTLASSLHQLAKILGQKRTKQQLFAVLDKFIKDTRDEIKVEAIKSLGSILAILDSQKREQLADIFIILQSDQKRWRIRQCIATQLSTLSEIFSVPTVFTYLVPMAFKLCSDIVSCVREEAACQIGSIVKKFQSPEGEIYLPAIIENIKGFSNSTKYTQRQTFILICQGLVGEQKILQQTLVPQLNKLVDDKIINVRISLAKFVSSFEGQIQQIKQMAQILKKDSANDVREYFQSEK